MFDTHRCGEYASCPRLHSDEGGSRLRPLTCVNPLCLTLGRSIILRHIGGTPLMGIPRISPKHRKLMWGSAALISIGLIAWWTIYLVFRVVDVLVPVPDPIVSLSLLGLMGGLLGLSYVEWSEEGKPTGKLGSEGSTMDSRQRSMENGRRK